MKDLANIDPASAADKGAWLHLKDPYSGELMYLDDDQPTPSQPIRIKLAGQDSTLRKWAEEAELDRRLDKAQRNNKLTIKSKDVKERGLKLLAAVTLEFENLIWEGKPLPCNAGTAKMIYNAREWIMQQADEFVADRKNFGGEQAEETASVMSPEAYLSEVTKNS